MPRVVEPADSKPSSEALTVRSSALVLRLAVQQVGGTQEESSMNRGVTGGTVVPE